MDNKGIITPDRSLVLPSRHVVHHSIGSHPVHFGIQPKSVKGRISHFENVPKIGQHMSSVSVLRTKKPRTDIHMVWVIRQTGLIPATVEVVESISQLGFENLAMLFFDSPELWEGKVDEINLACLGSITTDTGTAKGILFRVCSGGIFVDTFPARSSINRLPVDWIFPAFAQAS